TGTWNVNAGTLLMSGETFNAVGGSANVVGGTWNVDFGAFTMTGGTVGGQPHIRGSTLTIDPAATGAAGFLVGASANGSTQPHLAGTIHAGQDVLLSGQAATNHTTAVANGDLHVDGLLTMKSLDQAFDSNLNLAGHTLFIGSTGHLSIE